MNLASLLAQFKPGAASHKISIPATWHQGRTSYGGLSSALAYQAAKLSAEDLPPLQSAQIAFVGPLAGDVEVQANILRHPDRKLLMLNIDAGGMWVRRLLEKALMAEGRLNTRPEAGWPEE